MSSLHDFFRQQKLKKTSGSWDNDVIERLDQYIANGKMIRGALVFLGNELFQQKPSRYITRVALATEFFHSGLLIHDDIMDHDGMRRGKPSMHRQYADVAKHKNCRFPEETGTSLALCVGDAAFFYGYQLIAPFPSLTELFSSELTKVTSGQMQDIFLSVSPNTVHLEKILSMYRQKTGHYSVTLPLTAGAMLGGVTKETLRHIRQFGGDMGTVFQLVDDHLDMYGDPNVTGKPIGSDVRECKQTPCKYFLRNGVTAGTTDEKIQTLIARYLKSGMEALNKIPMNQKTRGVFMSFVEYLTNRVQ